MDIRALLVAAGQRLPPEHREAVLALGQAAVPTLVDIVEDDVLAREDAPGEGYAPIHAVSLLGHIGGAEAAAALVRFLPTTEPMQIIYSTAIRALADIGAPATEALIALATTGHTDATDAALEALVQSGVKDARIFALLLAGLKRHPELYAGHLAQYGDAAALPALRMALGLAQPPPEEAGPFSGQDIVEIAEAIEQLGGTLGLAGEEKLRVVTEKRDRFRQGLLRKRPGTKTRRR